MRSELTPKASSATLRGRHLLIIDVGAVSLAFFLAFALRLDAPSTLFQVYLGRYLWLVIPLIVVRVGVNLAFRLYQRLWRYASVDEMQAIILATSTGSILFGALVIVLGLGGEGAPGHGFPRSVVGIEWLLSGAFMGGSRFSLRTLRVRRWGENGKESHSHFECKRVLIAGAGDAGAMVVKEMRERPGLRMEPVGLVDDDSRKRGHLVHGVKVYGSCAEIPSVAAELGADTVIVAMPSAPGTKIREIVATCEEAGVRVLTVPGLPELISGKVTVNTIRPVQVEDLLRREPATVDLDEIAGFLRGATVMVTGAGGSIGSELCRQILPFAPSRLLMLGRGENSIFNIQTELLAGMGDGTEFVPLIADIRDLPRLKMLVDRYRPTVVFHAAAHKHVPLMESNPSEAVATNVFGTKNLLDVAAESGVERFVLVSTDKAVNPSSVMGATKRIAELMLQQTATRTGLPYVAVRFGNVLGSRGSVIPVFRKQIESGGPVTVTHSGITRYFMTVPEAVQLIIQAAAMGRGGEIFVLDMGSPIRIYDLAVDLIRLSGLEPQRDIEIRFTGLRPGEKLFEELFTPTEQRLATTHERIFVSSLQAPATNHLEEGLSGLAAMLRAGDGHGDQLRSAIAQIVPEYAYHPDTGGGRGQGN